MTPKERNIRGTVAWKLAAIGGAITRLAHGILNEVPTVDTMSVDWFDEGRRVGEDTCPRSAIGDPARSSSSARGMRTWGHEAYKPMARRCDGLRQAACEVRPEPRRDIKARQPADAWVRVGPARGSGERPYVCLSARGRSPWIKAQRDSPERTVNPRRHIVDGGLC